jgi:hypothetical protein
LEADRWLVAGDQALARGRPAEAVDRFERAARLDDERPDAELGQLRAWLQAGDYAHAVAWGRLVAGEHADSPMAAAWADAVESLARPGRWPAPALAPTAWPFPAPPARRPRAAAGDSMFVAVATGLVDGASRRLCLAPAVRERLSRDAAGRPLWVTEGTGAMLRLADDDDGSLTLDDPAAEPPAGLQGPAPTRAAAVPGRPVLVISTHPDDGRGGACGTSWPRLRLGLLAQPGAADPRSRVDLPGPPPADGSPVWDACGHWLGWVEGGALTPVPDRAAPAPVPPAATCASRASLDTTAHYGRWYAAVATVWRQA